MDLQLDSLPIRKARTLANRSRISVLAYGVLAGAVLASTSYRLSHPEWSSAAVLGAVAIGVYRLVKGGRIGDLDEPQALRWIKAFRFRVLLAGSYWGLLSGLATALALRGNTADALVVLVTTAGIAAGSTSSLSADVGLLRAYLAILILPITMACLASTTLQGVGTGAAVLVFLAFLFVQGAHMHREFLEAHAQVNRLALHAVALREAQTRAEAAQATADSANQAKTTFLANVSHEIRTPLSAVMGYAELLARPEVSDAERLSHAHTIGRSGRHLLSVLNDVLDMSKLDAGRASLHVAPCAFLEVLADVDSLMRVRAAERKLAFATIIETALPTVIQSDGTRIRQILLNLVGNAIKFTDEGRVELRVRLEGNGDRAKLVVDVVDTGPGLSATQLGLLFRPFEQAESTAARKYGGTGLGLSISRTLARLMDGDVCARSSVGHGSTFTLELPVGSLEGVTMSWSLAMNACVASTPPLTPLLENVRVLIAEDSADNQRLFSAFLGSAGAHVSLVENGIEAVKRAMPSKPGDEPFDVVLMDMQMPELDGYDAAARLRAASYRGPIVALTAHGLHGDRERCIAAGCDDYLSKPVDRAKMIEMVARWGRRPGKDVSTPSAPADDILSSSLLDDSIVGGLLLPFIDDLVKRSDQVRAATDAGDHAALGRVVHTLKGAGGSYGFMQLTEAAIAVEVALQDSDTGHLTAPVEHLLRTCRQIAGGRDQVAKAVEPLRDPR